MPSWAIAVRVVMSRPAPGKAWRVLVLRSRCRLRSMMIRRLPRARRVSWWKVPVMVAGRLAVAVPDRMLASTARRAAGKGVWRGRDLAAAEAPLRGGGAVRAGGAGRGRVEPAPQDHGGRSLGLRAG